MLKVKEDSDFGEWLKGNGSLLPIKKREKRTLLFYRAFWLKEGRVLLKTITSNLRLVGLDILEKGVVWGRVPGSKASFYPKLVLEALEDSLVIAVDVDESDWEDYLGDNPQLLTKIALGQIDWLMKVTTRLSGYLVSGLPAKIAFLLLELQESHSKTEDGTVVVESTHQLLADLIGASRENVTSFLNKLEKEGIVAKRRYQIALLQPEQLRKYIV